MGSETIRRLVEAAAPRFHLFGHQHNAFGSCVRPPTAFLNLTNTDGLFALVKPATVVDIAVDGAPATSASSGQWEVDLLRGRLRPKPQDARLPAGHL